GSWRASPAPIIRRCTAWCARDAFPVPASSAGGSSSRVRSSSVGSWDETRERSYRDFLGARDAMKTCGTCMICRKPILPGDGTGVIGSFLYIANVGEGRAFRYRRGDLPDR